MNFPQSSKSAIAKQSLRSIGLESRATVARCVWITSWCIACVLISMRSTIGDFTQAEPAANAWQLKPIKLPVNCFADRATQFAFEVAGPATNGLRGQWLLSADRQIFQRGSMRINVTPDKPGELSFEFRTPPVNAGVIAGAKLEVRIIDDQDQPVLAEEFRLWIYPENPFEIESAWLKSISIEFIEPNQALATRVKQLGPGSAAWQAERSRDTKPVLVIGSQESWDAAVKQRIEQAVRDGQRVLSFGVKQSTLELSFQNAIKDLDEVPAAYVAGKSFVHQVDPRLSVTQLPAMGQCRITSVGSGALQLDVKNEPSSWIYVECNFDRPEISTLSAFAKPKIVTRPQYIYCGLEIDSQWDESPTPRYLLARLLERMCAQSNPK